MPEVYSVFDHIFAKSGFSSKWSPIKSELSNFETMKTNTFIAKIIDNFSANISVKSTCRSSSHY